MAMPLFKYAIVPSESIAAFKTQGFELVASWLEADPPVVEAAEPVAGTVHFERGTVAIYVPPHMNIMRKRV